MLAHEKMSCKKLIQNWNKTNLIKESAQRRRSNFAVGVKSLNEYTFHKLNSNTNQPNGEIICGRANEFSFKIEEGC